ncbi:MAG: type II toxin-antitoxin system VapC family toxin [Hyphomicrobiaceae bacterium]
MRLLLDTHIWLWSVHQPESLGSRTTMLLTDTETDIWLSPVSIWEFLQLVGKRRFPVLRDPSAWISEALERFPHSDAPLTRDVALEIQHFRLPHRDPADMLLVATARALGLTLVTADRNIIESGAVAVVPND